MNKMMKKLLQIMLLALMPLCMQAQTVTIKASNASTYLSTTAPEVRNLSTGRFTVKDNEDLRNAKKIIIAKDLPNSTYRDFVYNHSGSNPDVTPSNVLANLEELELEEGHKIRQLWVWGTKLKKLIINNPDPNLNQWNIFRELNVAGSFLTEDSIILGDNVKFDQLHLHRNKITSLDKFYNRFKEPVGSNRTAGLYCNGGPYIRSEHAQVDDGTYSPTNVLREIDMSQIPLIVHGFQFRHNLLEHLDAGGHTNIANLLLSYNLLWSLDLNSVTTAPAENYNISPQKPVADLTVVKGTAEDGSGDEVRLNLPVEQNALFNGERLMPDSVKLLNQPIATQTLQHDGTQNYFKVASVADGATADLDLYEKDNGFSYLYDHRPNLGDDSRRYMKVEVKTYPYIMYIDSLTKQPKNNINFYSGTLWLDYDAVVPAGTTVWIVTGIKDKSKIVSGGKASAYDQLELKPIGEEGDLIPAGTAMFVRAKDQAGLYAFQKVWTHKLLGWSADTVMYEKVYTDDQLDKLQAMREKIANLGGNLLEGAGTETDFGGPRRALSLGFESGKRTGVIGFWPFTGTKAAPHRCFIRETTYKNATGSNSAKGATFFFNDPETTGITHVNNNVSTDDDAWYSLDGRRLSGKPSWKGVYIHKGRKEVIR